MGKKRLVMIGNGMAGMKAIEDICNIAPEMFDITIFGAERHPNYNRILLSKVLSGEMQVEDIILHDEKWYQERGITLHLGRKVTEIRRGRRSVIADDGTEAEYDALIMATGANPVMIPIPGVDKEGVVTFRSIDDCQRMMERSKTFKRAAVIGGGLLGLEAARGLIDLGMEVTVIHNQDTLMNLQLDSIAGDMLRQRLEGQGMKFRLSSLTTEVLGNGRVTGVRFADGGELNCDVLVMATGIRPNKELAEAAHLYCNRGIVVNDYMQTITDPSVYAVGECVEHRGNTYGLVAPLYEQAKILAHQITGNGFRAYRGSVVSTRLKVAGVNVFSAGELSGGSSSDVIEYRDIKGGFYKKLVLRDNRIVGAVMFGDTADGPRFFNMMHDKTDVSGLRGTLLFGDPMMGDAGHSGIKAVSMMSPDTVVCGCAGVSKKAIVDAVTKYGLTSRQEVIKYTKASGSCGGCAPLVEQILSTIIGNAVTPGTAPMCECTEFTHEEVKDVIRKRHLTSVMQVITALEANGEGCQICRPAINYYIQAAWPAEAEDDRQSRIANERLHANIQKDGTFSVVPRIYGGLTTPDELIRIGNTARKFNVPAVKLTGGQRIALLGIRKEELIDVWKDLGTPSGYAYGKALRTVKTCVGSEWCRFGTQDSMSLGIRLENMLERIWTPAKVKIAVSGCPRNCAEASIKDLGIVGIQGSWEIYCGGNGGVKVKAADLLCNVKEVDEVAEIVKAYLQFYREDARYNERTSVWIDRIGLKRVKDAVVVDRNSRAALAKRLDIHLDTLKVDPWNERIVAKETGMAGVAGDYLPINLNSAISHGLTRTKAAI